MGRGYRVSHTISPAGLHLIAGFEGWVPTWYRDSGGVETIGYGHTGPLPAAMHPPLTLTEGLELLRMDAATAQHSVNAGVRVSLGVYPERAQARFDALVSLTYNIGGGAFSASSLLHAINEKGAPRDWHDCAPLLLEWDHVGGAVVAGLLRRRKIEAALFVSGQYPRNVT